jgi:hypothetical protein
MALGCQLLCAEIRRATVVGSFPLSNALDRARKLHGYRINAYPFGVKSAVDSLPVNSGHIRSADNFGANRYFLGVLLPQTMLLADCGYDADWIRSPPV